ncbi:hypothetical protein K440DRAFT_637634 [Wilcoxina mikolae CBS 423.85]|nr:hypothetical protein K440DRAFT_637634 [Wilcoxina mikolae CBS 423.85]
MSHDIPGRPWENDPDYYLSVIPSSSPKPRPPPRFLGYCNSCGNTNYDNTNAASGHDEGLWAALNGAFTLDVFHKRQETLLQSLTQLKNMWIIESPFFKLFTHMDSIPCVSLKSLKFTARIHEVGQKVLAVTGRECPSTHNYFRVLKMSEQPLYGWRMLYHELRQLLCMPPHPNILPAPVAFVYSDGGYVQGMDTAGDIYNPQPRVPICGFLLHYLTGRTLQTEITACDWPSHLEESCKCSQSNLRQKLTAKWCRQLASALLHISWHGNGPHRPGFYSDLKPNNIIITDAEKDVVLIDFEQGGNWESMSAPEVPRYWETTTPFQYCNECYNRGLPTSQHPKLDEDDDVFQPLLGPQPEPWPPYDAHFNVCTVVWDQSPTNPLTRHNVPQKRYTNPPYGYLPFWSEVKQKAKVAAMVYSLGQVFKCLLEDATYVPEDVSTILGKMTEKNASTRPSLEEVLETFFMWEEKIDGEIAAGTPLPQKTMQYFDSKLHDYKNEKALSNEVKERLGSRNPLEGYIHPQFIQKAPVATGDGDDSSAGLSGDAMKIDYIIDAGPAGKDNAKAEDQDQDTDQDTGQDNGNPPEPQDDEMHYDVPNIDIMPAGDTAKLQIPTVPQKRTAEDMEEYDSAMNIDTNPAGDTAEVGHQDQDTEQESETLLEPGIQPQNSDTVNLPTPTIPQKRSAEDKGKNNSGRPRRLRRST